MLTLPNLSDWPGLPLRKVTALINSNSTNNPNHIKHNKSLIP